MQDPVEVLGLIAGALGTFAALPQLLKILRTRSAGDVSLIMFLMAMAGSVLWLGYGWLKASPSIVFWNCVSIVQMSVIIFLKLRHS